MMILSSLIFYATIVPHLAAPMGISDRLKLAPCACFFLPFPRYFWIVLNSGRGVGKKHLRASTQSTRFSDGNVMGNGLQNV